MTITTRVCLGLLSVAASGCVVTYSDSPRLERPLTREFTVDRQTTVRVDIQGGSITTSTGPAGRANVTLLQSVQAASEAAANDLLADYDIVLDQRGSVVTVSARRRSRELDGLWRRLNAVHFRVEAVVPADVAIDARTSGGSIAARGLRSAGLQARTSGGSIRADGGSGPMVLRTSGGSVHVGQALTQLDAETSGGSVTVDYVGPESKDVNLETSGGSVKVGVDPAARLNLAASTSGGSVDVRDLPLAATNASRSRVQGQVNGGGGRLQAHTSGGNVRIRAESADRVTLPVRSGP